jgi:predicted ATPase
MTEQTHQPPKLQKTPSGEINANSLADLLEWFLNFDQRVSLVRHPHVEELFEWKQADDAANGIEVYPFENAEARFAIGVFQALAENDSQAELQAWITEVLQALGESKQTNEDIAASYKLAIKEGASPVMESQNIPSKIEQRLFLTSSWLEALCTAEVRFLGWVYQELYGRTFEPVAASV